MIFKCKLCDSFEIIQTSTGSFWCPNCNDFVEYDIDLFNNNKKNNIIKDIQKAAKEVSLWPKWKRDIAGIESDYTITKIDFKRLKNMKTKKGTVDNIIKGLQEIIDYKQGKRVLRHIKIDLDTESKEIKDLCEFQFETRKYPIKKED